MEEFTPDPVLGGWRETHTEDQDPKPSERAGVRPVPGAVPAQALAQPDAVQCEA